MNLEEEIVELDRVIRDYEFTAATCSGLGATIYQQTALWLKELKDIKSGRHPAG